MRAVYDNSATIILLMSILTILAVATTVLRAQLLKDTFDDAAWEARWEIHDDGEEGVPTAWSVGGGVPDGSFGTTSNAVRGAGPSGGDEQAGSYALTLKAGSDSWTDYEISCDMYHMDNDYAGLFVRYVDELNYFRVWSKQEEADQGNNTTFGMDIVVDGVWTLNFKTGGPGVGQDGISGTPIPAGDNIQQKQWFSMTAEVVGDTVTMYMEGEKLASVTDPDLAPGGPLAKGKIALYNATNPMAYDNVVVGSLAVSSQSKLSTTWGILKVEYER